MSIVGAVPCACPASSLRLPIDHFTIANALSGNFSSCRVFLWYNEMYIPQF
jgi:hypothetical protein